MDVFNILPHSIAILAVALFFVFLVYGYFEALTVTRVSLDNTPQIRSIQVAHIAETCLKNGKKIIHEEYLDSLGRSYFSEVCKIDEFPIETEITMFSPENGDVEKKEWKLLSRKSIQDPETSEIFTNIIGKDGNMNIGKITTRTGEL